MESLKNCPACSSTSFTTFLKGNDYFLSKEEFTIVQCNECGLNFTNPRPGFEEILKYYDTADYISHDTSKNNIVTRIYSLARNFMLKRKFSIVSKYSKGKFILDIGCGTGEFLNFCKAKGFQAYGVELNEKPRESASHNYSLDIRKSIDNFSKEELTFDCITLWHVLEHVHELNNTINKIKDLLKPDGVVIIALPNCNSWDANYYKKFWAAYDLPRHLYHFNKNSFTKIAGIHNFKILQIFPQVLDSFYISLLSEKYLKGQTNLIKAVVNGVISNFEAGKTGKGHSSLIYVLIPEIS